MKTVTVGGVEFTRGRSKICVPLAFEREWGRPLAAVLDAPCDLVEWRADHFADFDDVDRTLEVLRELRMELGELPLIYTLRTRQEGGEAEVSRETYQALVEAVARSGYCNFVDVEAGWFDGLYGGPVEAAHRSGAGVIVSKHDFHGTPAQEEITRILETLLQCGGDICKLALMPASREDVLALMGAAVRFHREHPQELLIAISMGAMGAVTRVEAGFFDSAVTFASAGRASAPGQIDAAELRAILDRIEAVTNL